MDKLKESVVNEFSMKLQKSTQDMVDALLKIKNPMPKEIQSALIMMAKGYGLDYVKREVKKNPKDFYKNLKHMARAFPEFKSKKPPLTYSENDKVLTAVKAMSKDNFGSVIIVDKQKKVLGIVTERDLMRKLLNN